MKVKLLKKVRKRFEIIRFDKISFETMRKLVDYDELDYRYASSLTLPVYYLKDKKIFSFNGNFHPSLDSAKEGILEILRREKRDKLQKDISTKVWYTNS